MRLKSLKLAGFKSFANPTTFHFKHDITAIVGPNGCGKSNVIDAIRWVLGESSAKQIRGVAMSDVIFAGTDGKTARSMASVELHFEHTQEGATGIRHALNTYHELTLRRQITSDSKSDYFINNQKVRRRDVVDVFLGTGLSSRSYAVIEQGMIGRIIDADGQKLREFIEEAAGVSRYEARRSETQKQLEIAHANLERLDDLQGELTSLHKSLSKQAKSALTYQALNDELGVVHTQILTHRLYQAYHAHQTATHDLQTAHQTLDAQNEQMTQLRSRLQTLSQEHSHQSTLQANAMKSHHEAQLALTYATNERQTATTAQAVMVGELDKTTLALHAAKDRHARHADELALHRQSLQTLQPTLAKLQADITQAEQSEQALNAKLATLGQTLSRDYERRQSLQNELAVNDNAQKRHRQTLQKWQQKHAQWHSDQSELATLNLDELPRLEATLKELLAQLEELDSDMDSTSAHADTLRQSIATLDKSQHSDQRTHATLLSEHATLHRLVHPPKSTSADSDSRLPTIKDSLALTKAGEQYVDMLDKWLGLLLSDKVGDASDMVHLLSNAQDTLWHTKQLPSIALPEGLIRLSDLIESPKLALFERVAIATCPPTALPDGVCVLFGEQMLTACGVIHKDKFGKADEAFLATQKAHLARLDELDGQLDELDARLDATATTLHTQKSEHARTLVALDEYTEQAKRIRQEYHTTQNTHTRLSTQALAFAKDQERLAKERVLLDEEQQELASELDTLDKRAAQLYQQLDEIGAVIDDKKSEQTRLRQDQNALKQTLSSLQKQHQNELLSLQKHKQAIEFIQKNQDSHQSELIRLNEQQSILHAKLAQLEANLPILEQAHAHAHEVYEASYTQTQGFDEQLQTLLDEQSALLETQKTLQSELDQTHAKVGQLGATVAMGVAKMGEIGTQLGERCSDFELDAQLKSFASDGAPQGRLDEWLSKQKTLSQQISGLGVVNLAAADELAELEARLSPLQKERQDIEDSIQALKTAMGQINQKTKQLFLQTLKAVNEQMNALFVKVFGGGQASLSLVDDGTLSKAEQWQAPLVLMAQPKGKKNSRLAVLSGGEKTLTALSLVFAIFKQHPAPFCVLDEVDAPLDDANVQRFTNLIEELACEVQFIFISHNKLAMQKAHELKGVTMPTAGISALVSVDLGEAMAMVD